MSTYRSLPPGSTFRVCRKLIRNMLGELYSPHIDLERRSIAHIHLGDPVTGFTLSDQWQKMGIGASNFHVMTIDGFTFDEANHRIYWDLDGAIGSSLSALFVGAAGLEVTTGLGTGVTISMGLHVDGNLILETPLSFSAVDRIQMYGANEVMVDHNSGHADLLQSGSYIELFTKAETGETPTITARTLNVTFFKG